METERKRKRTVEERVDFNQKEHDRLTAEIDKLQAALGKAKRTRCRFAYKLRKLRGTVKPRPSKLFTLPLFPPVTGNFEVEDDDRPY